jgi:hypothetical protein
MNGPPQPGYLVVRVDEGGTYTGGLMVTDVHGLPLDFRYTEPITPTRLQRALYGEVLDRYLRSEVVLRTLLDALEARPTLLLVDDEALLEERGAGCPVAFLAASPVDALGAPGARRSDAPGVFLLQVADGVHPVRVTLPEGAEAAEPEVAAALVSLGERMDPLEPAARVRDALEVIASGEDSSR